MHTSEVLFCYNKAKEELCLIQNIFPKTTALKTTLDTTPHFSYEMKWSVKMVWPMSSEFWPRKMARPRTETNRCCLFDVINRKKYIKHASLPL